MAELKPLFVFLLILAKQLLKPAGAKWEERS